MACSVFSYSRYPLDFEIGGRNQNTQLCLRLCIGADVTAVLLVVRDVVDAFAPTVLVRAASLEDFSVVGVLAPRTAPPKSSALPGDFGVPFEAPNEANAPEPNPKALDAPAVGEGIAVEGEMVLKGFFVP